MSDNPVKKADLDKEGIAFEGEGKAELDKDGIVLEVEEASSAPDEVLPQDPESTVENPLKRRPPILIAALGAIGLTILIVTTAVFFSHGSKGETLKIVKTVQPHREMAPGADRGMVLDPFIVFYDAQSSRKSGVLIARVSLHVDSAAVSTIESRLFDVRAMIFRRLSSTASVYSPSEISRMLEEDLKDYPVKEVEFVQYASR